MESGRDEGLPQRARGEIHGGAGRAKCRRRRHSGPAESGASEHQACWRPMCFPPARQTSPRSVRRNSQLPPPNAGLLGILLAVPGQRDSAQALQSVHPSVRYPHLAPCTSSSTTRPHRGSAKTSRHITALTSAAGRARGAWIPQEEPNARICAPSS